MPADVVGILCFKAIHRLKPFTHIAEQVLKTVIEGFFTRDHLRRQLVVCGTPDMRLENHITQASQSLPEFILGRQAHLCAHDPAKTFTKLLGILPTH